MAFDCNFLKNFVQCNERSGKKEKLLEQTINVHYLEKTGILNDVTTLKYTSAKNLIIFRIIQLGDMAIPRDDFVGFAVASQH